MAEEEQATASDGPVAQHQRQQHQPTGTAALPQQVPSQRESYHSLSYAYQTYLRHDQSEQNHWEDVCRSYRQYASFAMAQWVNHQYRLHSLPEEHRQFLPAPLRQETPQFQQRAADFKDAAIRNQFCLDCILRHAGQKHSQQQVAGDSRVYSTDAQMSKVSSVLKSLARDWSADGKPERDMAYQPILQKVSQYLPPTTTTTPSPKKICVPGAGVGRLACELAALQYAVQGNEFSLYMLLASDFVLNGPTVQPSTPLSISPWMLESRNVHSAADQLRVVRIPDVDPYSMIVQDNGDETRSETASSSSGSEGSASRQGQSGSKRMPVDDEPTTIPPDFSMAAGDFCSIYGSHQERCQWDAVVACFFLDASPSIVEYLAVIFRMLRPGGFLFHFGPLLWHWSGPLMRPDDKSVHDYRVRNSYLDPKYLSSVDLSWEDVRHIMINMGFEILESSTGTPALYTADRRSMMNMQYRCIQFVARKPASASSGVARPSTAPPPSSS